MRFPRGLALLVAAALFMEMLDATILATALPSIAQSFGVDAVDVNVAVSSYLLVLAVLIPASGWMADRFGTRRVFISAIAVFTVASVGCALSTSLPMLVGMRALQGVGGAMMVPVGRLAVLRVTSKAELVRAIAYLTWPALTAPVLAPAVGGAIVSIASWRWIFLINVPIGIVGFLLALRMVPDIREAQERSLDWLGLVVIGAGVAVLVVALESVHSAGTDWLRVGLGIVAALILLSLAVIHLVRSDHPLIALGVLRLRSFRLVASSGSLYRLVIMGVPFVLPLLFQVGFGMSAFKAGLLVMALFAGNIAIKPLTTPLMRRFGIRLVLVGNGVLSVVCFGALVLISSTTPDVVIAVALFVSGALRSIGFTAYNSLAFADVDSGELTDANTLHATLQELASGLGIALSALVITLCTPLAESGDLSGGVPFSLTLGVLGAMLVPTVIESWRLPRDTGAVVLVRR